MNVSLRMFFRWSDPSFISSLPIIIHIQLDFMCRIFKSISYQFITIIVNHLVIIYQLNFHLNYLVTLLCFLLRREGEKRAFFFLNQSIQTHLQQIINFKASLVCCKQLTMRKQTWVQSNYYDSIKTRSHVLMWKWWFRRLFIHLLMQSNLGNDCALRLVSTLDALFSHIDWKSNGIVLREAFFPISVQQKLCMPIREDIWLLLYTPLLIVYLNRLLLVNGFSHSANVWATWMR